MSFILTYKDLSNPNFTTGVMKLVQCDKWKCPKKAYNLARIASLLDQELKTYSELKAKFIRNAASRRPQDVEKMSPEELKVLEELREEAAKFGEVSFEIHRHKVDFNDLSAVSLTPNEILALEPILENLPE
jgi:hypothetical protein